MSLILDNVNYGYAVATNQIYSAIGNPAISLYSSSIYSTGSVEILQYDIKTDSFRHKDTLKKYITESFYITTEDSEIITTDGSTNYRLVYDVSTLSPSSSRFGQSVALYDTTLIVGDSLYYYRYGTSGILSGSAVDIYDISGSINNTASYITSLTNSFESNYDSNTNFGTSIDIYKDTIVVGASSFSGSRGAVYIYKKISNIWTHYQTLSGSLSITGSRFGGCVKIDPSGSYDIIIGNDANISSNVYVYSYQSSSGYWSETQIFSENRSIDLTETLKLRNGNWPPYITSSVHSSSFGKSVAIYGNDILIGAPTDMVYFPYSGSSQFFHCGAAYFYENCNSQQGGWKLKEKTYGPADLINENYFGWRVALHGSSSLISSCKTNFPFSSSYLENTLYKKYACNPDDDVNDTLGQVSVYEKDSTSSMWSYVTNITKRKKYAEPYSVYGFSISMHGSSILIGSPVIYRP